jgi:hypothetical protein
MNPTTLQDYCRVRTLYSQSCAPDSLAEFSTLPPRSSSMVTTDGHRCGYCKGSPRACWVRGPSRAGSQPLCLGFSVSFSSHFAQQLSTLRRAVRLPSFLSTRRLLVSCMASLSTSMNRVVVPLSGAIKFPFSFKMMAIGIVIHIFCVGLPTAIIVRRFSMN